MAELRWREGYDFGVGVDLSTGRPLGDPVKRQNIVEQTDASGQSAVYSVTLVEDRAALEESLDVGVKASFRYGLFKASAGFELAQSSKISTYSVNLLITATIENATKQLRDVEMADHAARLWAAGNTEAFLAGNGDEYIRTVTTGGQLFVLLTIQTRDSTESEDMKATLTAGVDLGVAGGSLSTAIQKNIEKAMSQRTIFLTHVQQGGDMEIEYSPKAILGSLQTFAESVKKMPVVFSVTTAPYETCINLPPIPNKWDRRLKRDSLEAIAALRLEHLKYLDQIDFILENHNQFDFADKGKMQLPQLQVLRGNLWKANTNLMKLASDCADDINQCRNPSGSADESPNVNPSNFPLRKKPKKTKPKRTRPVVKNVTAPDKALLNAAVLHTLNPSAVPLVARRTNQVRPMRINPKP